MKVKLLSNHGKFWQASVAVYVHVGLLWIGVCEFQTELQIIN